MRLPHPIVLLPVIASAAIVVLGVLSFIPSGQVQVWPDNPRILRFWPYSDAENGGPSRLLAFSDHDGQGPLAASLSLGPPSAQNRYAGLDLTAGDSAALAELFRSGEALVLAYRTPGGSSYAVLIQTEVPGLTRPLAIQTRKFYFHPLPPADAWTTLRIPLSAFRAPGWWFDAHANASVDLGPAQLGRNDLSRAVGFQIVVMDSAPAGAPQRIELGSLRLERSPLAGAWVRFLLPLPLLALPAALLLGRRRSRLPAAPRLAPAAARLPLAPGRWEPLAIGNRADEDARRIMDLIGKRYHESELKLADVARESGISLDRLSPVLESATGLKFKPYLNTVRLGEASRLLEASDRTVSEIAYLVGYSSLGHFNRVFKESTGLAPLAYRRSKAGRPDAGQS